jgi:hypothetical protein
MWLLGNEILPLSRSTTARPHGHEWTAQIVRRKTPPKCRVLSTVIQKSGSSKRERNFSDNEGFESGWMLDAAKLIQASGGNIAF